MESLQKWLKMNLFRHHTKFDEAVLCYFKTPRQRCVSSRLKGWVGLVGRLLTAAERQRMGMRTTQSYD